MLAMEVGGGGEKGQIRRGCLQTRQIDPVTLV